MMELDKLDWKIIGELRKDCKGSYRRLAKRVGVHPGTFIQRVRRLEKEGLITGYSANLDYSKLGYDFMAVIDVKISHGKLLEVQTKLKRMPEIITIYDVTGETDSVVVARTRSRAEFSALVKKMLAVENVVQTNTHVVLNVIKEESEFMPG